MSSTISHKLLLLTTSICLLLYGSIILRQSLLAPLYKQAELITQLVTYDSGQWDIGRYLNRATQFNPGPLYILTRDGYVIDRRQPIPGLLDTADFDFSSSFSTPQSIRTPSGETWRLHSTPLLEDNQLIGTVLTGYRLPEFSFTAEIDTLLKQTGEEIAQQLTLTPTSIDTSNLSLDPLNFRIEFSVVDRFDHVLAARSSPPAYLATSEIEPFLSVQDQSYPSTQGSYLLAFRPIISSDRPIGLIILGRPINFLIAIFLHRATQLLLTVALIPLLLLLKNKTNASPVSQSESSPSTEALAFNPTTYTIAYAGNTLRLPPDTNQALLFKTLFKRPNHRFAYDELAEILFGDSSFGAARSHKKSIYDTARLVNKKTQENLGFLAITIYRQTFQVRLTPSKP